MAWFCAGDLWVFALADGAGGTGSGGRAADFVVEETRLGLGVATPAGVLRRAGARAAEIGAQTTGVVVHAIDRQLSGAVCGDSEAWLYNAGIATNLTAARRRKPLLGSGGEPVEFGPVPFEGTLLIASDGLFAYARAARIEVAMRGSSLEAIVDELLALPRLASGDYQDDISVLLARADA